MFLFSFCQTERSMAKMLEKFTPEEIAQIKKELGIKDDRTTKSEVVMEHRIRLDNYLNGLGTRFDKDDPLSTKGYGVNFEIYTFTDLILENFEPSASKNKFGNKRWKRSAYVTPEKKEQYARVYGKLVDIYIEENAKMRAKTKV